MNIRNDGSKPMDNEYEIVWQDLKITLDDIAESVGYPRNETPVRIAEAIGKLWVEYCSLIQPQAVVKYFSAQISGDELICADARFLVGKKIAAQVTGLQEAALFVCTIGEQLEREASRLTECGELMQGYVLDSIGSLAAERLAEWLQNQIEAAVQSAGKTISTRFSPGYCDWPVSAQLELFTLLGGAPCNVVLSSSAMMRPLKSISGFIGIGDNMVKGYACNSCEQQVKCLYRNRKDKK
ncbi:MAG: vitamin B12 dependent-methionine synthase activation domain-containing protein [Negativicutes bacterium]|jgi:cobalamin-dependent methionine synthase I